VVCSYNGAKRIGNTLRALKNQKTDTTWELLVVDDGSTDGTGDLARGLGVAVIDKGGNFGLSAARNAGIEASRGRIVAFTDDDVVPPRNWVERLAETWVNAPDHVKGIGGNTDALDVDSVARRYVSINNPLTPLELSGTGGGIVKRLLTYLRQPDGGSSARAVYSLVGANMSFRREALVEVGGFDPVIRFGGDEEDLCRRLRERHGDTSLWVDPRILVLHDFDRSLKDTLRRSRAYGRGNGRDWVRRGGVPAIRPMPVLLLLAALSALMNPRLALLGVLGLPVLVYRKALRRGIRQYGIEAVTYPYIGALQEIHATRGFIEEANRHRRKPS
jgi:glycosyltransferase involved in cell wall biosynthesis